MWWSFTWFVFFFFDWSLQQTDHKNASTRLWTEWDIGGEQNTTSTDCGTQSESRWGNRRKRVSLCCNCIRSLPFFHYFLYTIHYSTHHTIYIYVAQHRRLTDKLSDAQVELKTLQKRLKDAEQQVATMKQQLHKYVQEVKRAEDLLLQKVNLSMHILLF